MAMVRGRAGGEAGPVQLRQWVDGGREMAKRGGVGWIPARQAGEGRALFPLMAGRLLELAVS